MDRELQQAISEWDVKQASKIHTGTPTFASTMATLLGAPPEEGATRPGFMDSLKDTPWYRDQYAQVQQREDPRERPGTYVSPWLYGVGRAFDQFAIQPTLNTASGVTQMAKKANPLNYIPGVKEKTRRFYDNKTGQARES